MPSRLSRNAGEKHIPFEMPTRGSRTGTGEGVLEDFETGYLRQERPSPAGRRRGPAFAPYLVEKESAVAFADAVIVRLRDPPASVHDESDESSFRYGRAQQPVVVETHPVNRKRQHISGASSHTNA